MNHLLIDSLFEIMIVLMGTSDIKLKKWGGGITWAPHMYYMGKLVWN